MQHIPNSPVSYRPVLGSALIIVRATAVLVDRLPASARAARGRPAESHRSRITTDFHAGVRASKVGSSGSGSSIMPPKSTPVRRSGLLSCEQRRSVGRNRLSRHVSGLSPKLSAPLEMLQKADRLYSKFLLWFGRQL